MRGSVRYDESEVEQFHPPERAYSVCAGNHGGTPCLSFNRRIVAIGGTPSILRGNGTAIVRSKLREPQQRLSKPDLLLARLQAGAAGDVQRKRPPTLRDFSTRFLEWVDNSQRLTPNGKRYYRYGWRLLSHSELAGVRLDQITKDLVESIVFKRPTLDRKRKNEEGKYVLRNRKGDDVVCTGHYTNQALRTLKRMQTKAIEWNVLRERPKVTLADAPGRDRIDR